MAALQAGALALLEKPPAVTSPQFEQTIRHLVSTVKAMADVKVVQHRRQRHEPPTFAIPEAAAPRVRTRIVALAASTGGPAALGQILSSLPANFPVPIVVVQHMARGFLGGFASWLSGNCTLKVKLAAAGDPLKPSTVYVAGDDRHLGVTPDFRIKLDDCKAISGFRPSANYLFASVAAVYGASAVAVILTGMGQDGLDGLRQLRAAGGRIIAQDEASCVVYGMPRAVIEAGLADTILPLSLIGQALVRTSAAGQDRGKGGSWV
jgi:two-component system chemotaxis response regulator CheB